MAGSTRDYKQIFDWEFFQSGTTWEEHFLGSYRCTVTATETELHFRVTNDSSLESFFARRHLEKLGINLHIENRENGPGGTKSQVIVWSEPKLLR